MNNLETIILILVLLAVAVYVLYPMYKRESFTTEQRYDTGYYDPMANMQGENIPMADRKNYESLVYDDVTKSIMTGSQFMANTGLITPPWIAPAWAPDALGPSSKSEFDASDYENDSRMLYNKCSLSCCSSQYPTPFQLDTDPTVCNKDGENKYLSSQYTCMSNTGGSGCLCMSEQQVGNL